MGLKNFDELMKLVPKTAEPLTVALAGSDSENMLKGVFKAQREGMIRPILVGNKEKTVEMLKKLDLDGERYSMVEIPTGHSCVQSAIDLVNDRDADILMRGNLLARDFLMPILDRENGLRTDKTMSHVSLAMMPEYPRLLAMSDMAVIINPDLGRKKAIIQNMVDALTALGYDNPKLALLALVEKVTFHMADTVEAQRLVHDHGRNPFAKCELWGPISYDLIISKESARLKDYDCPYVGGGFDGLIAPELTTANTLLKTWLIHAHATTCGAVLGARVPIAFTSRSSSESEAFYSLAFSCILYDWYKKQGILK